MANKFVVKAGQSPNSRAPAAIENAEHYDLVGLKRVSEMTPATYTISPASNTETVLQPRQMVRFFNTTASVAFVWLGDAGTSPGSVDITNALAIAPNSAMTVATAELLDGNAIAFKTSAATVQAATLE